MRTTEMLLLGSTIGAGLVGANAMARLGGAYAAREMANAMPLGDDRERLYKEANSTIVAQENSAMMFGLIGLACAAGLAWKLRK